ncbi:MAG: hypothetical protein KTR32_12320 [Granulosicoccus sp.]|nr:hypothetical protein [Granulosicoccus sp.]
MKSTINPTFRLAAAVQMAFPEGQDVSPHDFIAEPSAAPLRLRQAYAQCAKSFLG